MAAEKRAKVTVIVPVYNTAQYVGKCLDSLTEQTLAEIQVICVNDGSTDGSGEILQAYAGKDSRIRIIEQAKQGPATARNAAMEIAEGEYCCFVDSDDWLETEALEQLYAKASEERLDVLFFAGKTEYDTEELARNHNKYFDRAYQRDQTEGNTCSGREMLQRQIEAKQYWRSACLSLIRIGFLREAGIRFREGISYEDNLFTFLLCLRAKRADAVAEQYYRRLLRDHSLITSERDSRDLYGYVTSIADGISLLQETEGTYGENEAFYAVINQTVKRAYTIWKGLDEAKREQMDSCFRNEAVGIREGDLYHSLFLSRFREEEERRRLVEEEKKLQSELRKAMWVQDVLRKEKQEVYDSSSYRLGHALLTPVRIIRRILKRKEGN